MHAGKVFSPRQRKIATKLAIEFGVGKATINDWKRIMLKLNSSALQLVKNMSTTPNQQNRVYKIRGSNFVVHTGNTNNCAYEQDINIEKHYSLIKL